jgi:hypothetical protein
MSKNRIVKKYSIAFEALIDGTYEIEATSLEMAKKQFYQEFSYTDDRLDVWSQDLTILI